jgi:ankyrin repeat protein
VLKANGNTPAHHAKNFGYDRILDELLRHGADEGIKNYKGKTACEGID